MNLRLDFCGFDAAKYACEHWHYSKTWQAGKAQRIGVWEDGKFIGVVIFSQGACNAMGAPYGLKNNEVCELSRVALTGHKTPVTKIIKIALKFIKEKNTLLRLIVSYADPNHGHHGGIYQGGNWIYVGKTSPDHGYIDSNGKQYHSRSVSETGYREHFGHYTKCPKPSELQIVKLEGKHKYLMPLDDEIRAKVLPLSKPYPKRVGSIESDARPFQDGKAAQVRPPRTTSSEVKA